MTEKLDFIHGIIPTRVGTSRYKRQCEKLLQDHPHACGDKLRLFRLLCLSLGSSPRVWGQVTRLRLPVFCSRIIPTRVGTSSSVDVLNAIRKDHPHACGDKALCALVDFLPRGSSPRVWGQDSFSRDIDAYSGIIPTRVGTSLRQMSAQAQKGDHPHACGDK